MTTIIAALQHLMHQQVGFCLEFDHMLLPMFQEDGQECIVVMISSWCISSTHPVDMLPNGTYTVTVTHIIIAFSKYAYIPLAFSKSTCLIDALSSELHLLNSKDEWR